MAITPRKEEVAAVVEVLESGEFEDSASMARELVKVIATALQKRDGYGVGIGLRTDDMRLPHGPFFTILEAKRVVKEAEARGLIAFIAPLLGAGNALRDEEEVTYKQCTCGHPAALHGSNMKPKAMTSLGCGTYHPRTKQKCSCKGFEAA